MSEPSATLRLIGGPTALIRYGWLALLTDPTFDPPGPHLRPGSSIVLDKLSGPAVPADQLVPVDAVLLSHDHHLDNLDHAGRKFLPRADQVLTTIAGAERVQAEATGMEPGDTLRLKRPGHPAIEITALPAEHGPPEVAPKNAPVIGFMLRGGGLPTVYVSGDNASVEVVRSIVADHGPIDAAVLFAGGAELPELWGPGAYLTLTPESAVEVAQLLDDAVIVPVHQEGWGHLSFGPADLERAFAGAGEADRLRSVLRGQRVSLS
jgi:L-ascorbate metabolism protein UlaG (beta-lactamase superfamily)